MRIFDVLDTFSDFKKPIHLSEITISAYSNSDEDWQFKHKLLKICTKFGLVKNVEAIIYWNLIDGYTAGSRPNDMGAGENKYCGALLNFDLSPKPAFKVIDKLINEEWHTEGIYIWCCKY